MCTWRNSSSELDTFAPSILHPLAVFEFFIHCLGAYVILFKTPATMGTVKRSMLTLHLFGAFLDLYLSALSTQYLFVPVAAGYSTGFLSYIGISGRGQEYIFFTTVCLTGCAILGFFENRFNAIVHGNGSSFFADKKRLLYIGVHSIWAVTFFLPVIYTTPDQTYGKEYFKRTLPCVPVTILDHPDFFVFAIDITLLAVLIAIPITAIPSQCIFFAVRIARFLYSTKAKSIRTHKLQKQFFIALCIQISIPMTFLTFPVMYNVFALSEGYFNQAMNNITINIISLHGLFSSIVMMIAHKPYRQAVTDMFCKPCSRVKALKSKNHSVAGPVDATFVIVSKYSNH